MKFFWEGAIESPTIESIKKDTVILKKIDNYVYSMDGNNWQESNVFFNIPMDEIVCFYQKSLVDNAGLSISNATKAISISAPKVLVGRTSILIKPIDGYEYGIEELVWQDSNCFDDYIVNGETYTVYHRPVKYTNIFVAYEGTTVKVCGDDKIIQPKAIDLLWIRNLILNTDIINNFAADFNNDWEIDARDIVAMKKAVTMNV